MFRNLIVLSVSLFLAACSGDNNDDGNHGHHHHGDSGHHHHDDAGHHHDAANQHEAPDLGDKDLGVVVTQAAKDYCECMLFDCHDEYHARWGEDHVEAAVACQTEAAMLPQAGSPQTEGNSAECRLHHCASLEDGSTCEGALGAACVD